LFAPGQFRWTATGILCGICAGTVYYLIAILLPKALVSQGAAVALSFGLSSLVFAASIPGKLFNGFIMEILGRRWTITGAFLLSIPGLLLMVMAHRAGSAATIVFSAGALITGFTTLSIFPAARMYLSEQFPTALRGRGHFFRESFGRIFAGVIRFVMVSHTAPATIFFGTIQGVWWFTNIVSARRCRRRDRRGAELTGFEIERVARRADCAHEVGAAIGVERLAQAADMHVDGARLDIDVVAPDRVQ
jgi:MFS family permease